MVSYKTEFQKLQKSNERLRHQNTQLSKLAKLLTGHILRIKKKCDRENLWLIASCDPHKPLTNEDQQGPLVSKLYIIAEDIQKELK